MEEINRGYCVIFSDGSIMSTESPRTLKHTAGKRGGADKRDISAKKINIIYMQVRFNIISAC